MHTKKHFPRQNGRVRRWCRGALVTGAVVLCAMAAPRVALCAQETEGPMPPASPQQSGDVQQTEGAQQSQEQQDSDQAEAQEAMQILERTAATYKKLGSYEFKVTIQLQQGGKNFEQHATISGERPGKYRVEDDDPKGQVEICDGQTKWEFDRGTNKYTKTAAAAGDTTPISDFENIAQHVTAAGILREAQYNEGGKSGMVYVVEVARDQWPEGTLPGVKYMTYTIDEETYAVHGVGTEAANDSKGEHYVLVKWNEPVLETNFAFIPPGAAREATSVPAAKMQSVALIGSEAPDFTLEDMSGKAVSLHDFRGKVVVVDFWASWCGPCQEEMPYIQHIYEQMAGQGVMVLGLNDGEDHDTVAQFTKDGSYTFPVLLGGNPEVTLKYYLGGLPTTVVIDRQGKITYYEDGFGTGLEIVNAVKAALKK